MEYSVSVSVLKDDKSEEEVEVYFETEDLDDIAKINKKIIFIKEQARKQYNDETYNEFTRQEEFYYDNL